MKITKSRSFLIPFFCYLIAGILGYVVYEINKIYFPKFATIERLIVWTLLFGTMFTIGLWWERRDAY